VSLLRIAVASHRRKTAVGYLAKTHEDWKIVAAALLLSVSRIGWALLNFSFSGCSRAGAQSLEFSIHK
jgi:hypothetical protein